MSTHSPKRDVFAQLARVGNALASGVRLELLELLAQGERSVDRLSTLTGVTVANTSQHLQKLKQAGLILGRKQGQFVYYRIASDEVVRMLAAMSRVGEAHIAEIERIVRLYFLAKDDFEPIAATELLDRARKGLVTVLDVRPPEEFVSGHVPGALNIPVEQLTRVFGSRTEHLSDLRVVVLEDVLQQEHGPFLGGQLLEQDEERERHRLRAL